MHSGPPISRAAAELPTMYERLRLRNQRRAEVSRAIAAMRQSRPAVRSDVAKARRNRKPLHAS